MSADEHLSFDELAELAEGLLARRKKSAARAHLASCDECAARSDALARTTTALGDLGPLTMPADVVARLDRALASAAQEAPGDTVVPDLGAVRRRRAALSLPYAAAASVVVVAIVGVGIATLGHRHHRATADNAASANKPPLVSTLAPHQLIKEESGQTYTPESLTALIPTLVSGTSNGLAAAGSAQAPEIPAPSSHGDSHSSASTGSAPTPANAPERLSTVAPKAFAAANAVPPSLRRYAESKSALSACAAYITDTAGAAPLAVDFARWSDPATHIHSAPSLILVFADPDDATILDVYVVAPACDGSSLRDFTTIPRDGSP